MADVKQKMLNLLVDLRENHNVFGIKADFEAEGATYEEIHLLKEFTKQTRLSLAIKIGGCEAVRDIREADCAGAEIIVAPMIESVYALKKFVDAAYSTGKKLYINIETITGFENFNKITDSEAFIKISGIVFGRSDMSGSLGINDVNDKKILEIAKTIKLKMDTLNKDFIIGGGVSGDSAEFFNDIQTSVETRKIIFSKFNLEGIEKAIDFEIMWIENKKELTCADITRLQTLQRRKKVSDKLIV